MNSIMESLIEAICEECEFHKAKIKCKYFNLGNDCE